MKNQILDIKLNLNYSEKELEKAINKKAKRAVNKYQIVKKSLDARKKNNIVWSLRIEVNSSPINFKNRSDKIFDFEKKKRDKRVIIVGSGPAGIFSGLTLLKAGFNVTLLEKGFKVEERDKDIIGLTQKGIFKENSNFAFGEGGAGTYSDGKLTSRSKHISKEKDFILSTYIKHGAPEEIYFLTHPHVGSDNLKTVCQNLREEFYDLGGDILFDTSFKSFKQNGDKITSVESTKGIHECDYLILATGHSSFTTYRELIKKGVIFNTKNFALGFRAEHPQELINRAQWGCSSLEGIKAAEYRLTSKCDDTSVYSFCMCPGGVIVPAAAMERTSVVNGMSYYKRDGEFANAAVVAGYNFSRDFGRDVSAMEALDELQKLEERYFEATGGFSVPGMKIEDFISSKSESSVISTSYPLGVTEMDLAELLPKSVVSPLRVGLNEFSKKLKGYQSGNILGLESKTSSPIQVSRNREGLCEGYSNLYFSGEGSGWAGGIISSGADGIKAALNIIEREG